MDNILFLDLSSHSTGWCVADKYGNLLKYGCIQDTSTLLFKRLENLYNNLKTIIQENEIAQVVAEEVHLDDFKNTVTYKVLIWCQGVARYAIYNTLGNKTDLELIQASSWRSKIGIKMGKGIRREELKKQDMEYVKLNYNLEVNDDIADSICLKDAYFIKHQEDIGKYEDEEMYDWK